MVAAQIEVEQIKKKFKIEKLWDAETNEEVDHVSPGVKGQQILLHIPIKCEKDWILRRVK